MVWGDIMTSFLELAMSLLDFSPRIPLGTFSILPLTYVCNNFRHCKVHTHIQAWIFLECENLYGWNFNIMSHWWCPLTYGLRTINICCTFCCVLLYMFVYHNYDLSTLVGCWSSVYIKRIIYNFFWMCVLLITRILWLLGRLGTRKPV